MITAEALRPIVTGYLQGLKQKINHKLPTVPCHLEEASTAYSIDTYISFILKSRLYSIDLCVNFESKQHHILITADMMYCENPILSEMDPIVLRKIEDTHEVELALKKVEDYVFSQEELIVKELRKDLRSPVDYPDSLVEDAHGNNMEIDIGRLRSSAQVAFLGAISKPVLGICIELDEHKLEMTVYSEISLDENQREALEVALTEIYAANPFSRVIEDIHFIVNAGQPLRRKGIWVFVRYGCKVVG